MPYTNTQLLSNTRTTVTIVLSIIFGVSIIPSTALGTEEQKTGLVFTLENTDVLTLYQEVKVKIEKDSAVTGTKEFKDSDTFKETDEVYFIKTDVSQAKCAASPGNGITPRKVTVPDRTKAYAEATVIIRGPEFEVGGPYKMCYISETAVYDAVYKAKVGTTPTAFRVENSMFRLPVMTPTTVYAGQGPIELSITVTDPKADRTFPSVEDNKLGTWYLYLIPCTTADDGADQCTKKDDIAASCSSKTNAIATDVVTRLNAATLKTTFTAPVAKSPTSYMICVPYCFKAGKCASDLISWALVDSGPIQIAAADPVSYTLEPSSPQARTLTKITFTGTGLAKGDKIRIIPQGQQCSSSTARDFLKIEYTELEVTPAADTKSEFKFRLKGVLKAPGTTVAVTLQVCYAHAANLNVWAPVYKTAAEKTADLIISPLQPTGFSIVPQSPETEQLLQVKYTGTGLGAQDSSYLVQCTPEGSDQRQSTTSLDYCDDTTETTRTKYPCTIATDTATTVICTFLVYPDVATSQGMQLCACYRKQNDPNYALVAGSVTVPPKTIVEVGPTYTITPYPFTVGTNAKLKFAGTGLSAADEAKIIGQGGKCNTDKALVGVSITNKVVSGGEIAYTITGSTSVCFTVCYLRDSTWTVSTNTRSGVGTTTCPLPYSFISPSLPTVTITKPKSFSVISPASPAIGQVLQVEFVRAAEIGLTSQDSSYLVKCTIEGSNPLPPILCDDKAAPQYVCEIAVNGVNVNCKVLINPAVMTSVGMELCSCYKKSGQAKYALVAGSVKIGPRNPTYTISPYPFYVGQGAKLKFAGTGLSAADKVKIIAQGGDCNTGNALVGVSITAKKGEQDTYIIMGSKSVCFTVCYRRGTVWTVSTNSDSSKVTTTCTSASSAFISDTRLHYTLSPQEPSKQQTVTVTFKDDSSYSVGSLIIIPIKEECATSLCEGLAPCDHPLQSGDTYEVKTPTRGIFMATLKGSYVICTRATSASELPWIPIRNANPTGNRHYTFDVGDKVDASADKSSKTTVAKGPPKVSITVPPIPGGNKTTTLSATAISSTIPAVLITSVVFLYLYNW